jgi:tetratricopeptide (TPR) repeat protein
MKLSEFCRIKWERARDLKNKGAYLEAEEELKEALEEQPDSPLLNVSLAELYLRQDRLTEARILVEPTLSADPHYPQALYVLGEIFFKEGKLNEALECFRNAFQKDPRPYLIRRIAKTQREMGRYKEALDTLDAALADEREDIRFLKEKALTFNRMKQWDDALEIYEKVQKLDPEDSFVRKEIYR